MGAAAGPAAAATGVTVSLDAIYRIVLEVQQGQVVMGGDVRAIKDKLEKLGEDFNDHEERIRKLEDRRTVSPAQLWTGLLGAITAGTALVTLIVNLS